MLNNEVALLQGLRFDLIVHSPYRALTGLLEVGRRGLGCGQGNWRVLAIL